jgi:galactokinase
MNDYTARAPGRVELLGNHTDYNEGVVLAAAINHAVTVRGAATAAARILLTSTFAPQPVDVSVTDFAPLAGAASWANYALGVVYRFGDDGF